MTLVAIEISSPTSKKWIFAMSNEWFFATSNERIVQRVASDFLQQATSATSNERILQRVTSDFTTSNEQRVNFNE